VSASLVILLAVGTIVKIILGERTDKPAVAIRSLAVLPLQNRSGDSSQEYLADGMTDELVTALANCGVTERAMLVLP
jgi:TolB-like protein